MISAFFFALGFFLGWKAAGTKAAVWVRDKFSAATGNN